MQKFQYILQMGVDWLTTRAMFEQYEYNEEQKSCWGSPMPRMFAVADKSQLLNCAPAFGAKAVAMH